MVKETLDISFIIEITPKLLGALPVTLSITGFALLFGWLDGFLITCGKVSRFRALAWVLDKLTVIVRGIPTVVLLYIVYFGLPGLVKSMIGISISKWPKRVFCVIALSIELAVSSSEMFRSAWNSLDQGQREAAHAIGMSKRQAFFHILAPQGLYVILPNLGSAVLSVIQGTALVYTLGIMDILGKARILDTNAFSMKTFEAYLTCALLYWGMSLVINGIFRFAEKKMGKGMHTVGALRQEG